jgi:hypothetical protein
MEGLIAAVGAPALISAVWVIVGLKGIGSPRWALGGVIAAVIAGALVLIAAFVPLLGALATLGVPVLCVAGGILLQLLFARIVAVATAVSVPFALLIALQQPLFPFLMPLVLAVPLWTIAWIEREEGHARYALIVLASIILAPVIVIGAFLLVRPG